MKRDAGPGISINISDGRGTIVTVGVTDAEWADLKKYIDDCEEGGYVTGDHPILMHHGYSLLQQLMKIADMVIKDQTDGDRM